MRRVCIVPRKEFELDSTAAISERDHAIVAFIAALIGRFNLGKNVRCMALRDGIAGDDCGDVVAPAVLQGQVHQTATRRSGRLCGVQDKLDLIIVDHIR